MTTAGVQKNRRLRRIARAIVRDQKTEIRTMKDGASSGTAQGTCRTTDAPECPARDPELGPGRRMHDAVSSDPGHSLRARYIDKDRKRPVRREWPPPYPRPRYYDGR